MSKTISIKTNYVQIMDRKIGGLTLIGQPIRLELGKKIRKELFGNNPDIILYPSVPPQKSKLKKVI